MTKKKHAFSTTLMVVDAKEDAVHSDMVVIDRLKKLPTADRLNAIRTTFNLSDDIAKRIVDNNLYIALIEASSLINNTAETSDEVTTLRAASGKNINHYLITKMVEKYEILIALFALQLSSFGQKEILAELQTSRRSANTIKAIFQPQITAYVKALENTRNENSAAIPQDASIAVRLYALSEMIKNIPEIYTKVSTGRWFNNLRVVIEMAQQCQVPINKIDKETIQKIYQQTKILEEGNQL